MINFSSVSSRSAVGRLLRLPLRLLPGRTVVPILQGPARGRRWIVGSSNHGCWLGSYEAREQQMVADALTSTSVFYDVGANVGFYTVMAACVASEGHVVAFEPMPSNVTYLRRHVALNRLANVDVVDCAVGDAPGTARFAFGESNAMGRLDDAGEIAVTLVSLDSFVASGRAPLPHVLKIDVEGAEGAVLRGAVRLFEATRPTVFLALHGVEDAFCRDFLVERGYTLAALGERRVEDGGDLVAWPASGPLASSAGR